MTVNLKIFLSAILLLISTVNTMAASTDWVDLGGGQARLLATKDAVTNQISGVLEVKLNSGWKTYWRSPGNSGIPPEFDFGGSDFLTLESVSFPVPKWIETDDYSFLGYTDKVSFPFSAKGETMDTSLRLDLLIGVCENICIPATAQFSIPADALNTSDPGAEVEIELAQASLPLPPADDFRVYNLSRDNEGLILDMAAPPAPGKLFVIAEQRGRWISDPVPVSRNGNNASVRFLVPASVLDKLDENTEWSYTLLQLSDDNHTIARAVEGTLELSVKP